MYCTYLYCTYLYCTHYSAYIKAVPCINLFAKYIIQSYFAHFQSLFSLFLFSTWYQSHFLVAFTRQNLAFLRCYRFTVSSPRSQTLSPFLPSSESSSPSYCLTQAQLHWIDLTKICPLPPKLARSGLARTPTCRQKSLALKPRVHALPRVDQRRHTPSRTLSSVVPCQP